MTLACPPIERHWANHSKVDGTIVAALIRKALEDDLYGQSAVLQKALFCAPVLHQVATASRFCMHKTEFSSFITFATASGSAITANVQRRRLRRCQS